ncbi:hypothetical protein GKC44_03610 [Lactobacillus parabuchneri]|uniref:Uncharacterized protein n=2 Tax=Lentilactobacillus parabuchneri TaxID=152331 RepID=A0A844EER2_9LACO|nr:hypothetical protein [Lentilactobacillus parabuchneri]
MMLKIKAVSRYSTHCNLIANLNEINETYSTRYQLKSINENENAKNGEDEHNIKTHGRCSFYIFYLAEMSSDDRKQRAASSLLGDGPDANFQGTTASNPVQEGVTFYLAEMSSDATDANF